MQNKINSLQIARYLERIKYVSIGIEYHSGKYKMGGYKR